jgi:hypothetical protein
LDRGYAGSWMRTSGNLPSRTFVGIVLPCYYSSSTFLLRLLGLSMRISEHQRTTADVPSLTENHGVPGSNPGPVTS